MLGNFLAIGDAVFQMKSNSVFDVDDGFLVCVTLAVATLKAGTGNEVSVGVRFDNDGKSEIFHTENYRPVALFAPVSLFAQPVIHKPSPIARMLQFFRI
jgi:hypothetical protein